MIDDVERAHAGAGEAPSLLPVVAATDDDLAAWWAVEVLGGLAGDGEGSDP